MEKLKAKEEAEDLAQEMAELRYQMTGLLEEERKRRACVEKLSLQRIAELEEQVSTLYICDLVCPLRRSLRSLIDFLVLTRLKKKG